MCYSLVFLSVGARHLLSWVSGRTKPKTVLQKAVTPFSQVGQRAGVVGLVVNHLVFILFPPLRLGFVLLGALA